MSNLSSDTSCPSKLNDCGIPDDLDVHFVAGASGLFHLYEDDDDACGFTTDIEAVWHSNDYAELAITIPQPVSESGSAPAAMPSCGILPAKRSWRFRIVGVGKGIAVSAFSGSVQLEISTEYCESRESLSISLLGCDTWQPIRVEIKSTSSMVVSRNRTQEKVDYLLQSFNLGVDKKWEILRQLSEILHDVRTLFKLRKPDDAAVSGLVGSLCTITPSMAFALIETIEGCGFSYNSYSRRSAPAVVWSSGTGRLPVTCFVEESETSNTRTVEFSEPESLIVWPKEVGVIPTSCGSTETTGTVLRIDFGDALAVRLELRDVDDTRGPPTPELMFKGTT